MSMISCGLETGVCTPPAMRAWRHKFNDTADASARIAVQNASFAGTSD
jgi:hypothetical protein